MFGEGLPSRDNGLPGFLHAVFIGIIYVLEIRLKPSTEWFSKVFKICS